MRLNNFNKFLFNDKFAFFASVTPFWKPDLTGVHRSGTVNLVSRTTTAIRDFYSSNVLVDLNDLNTQII